MNSCLESVFACLTGTETGNRATGINSYTDLDEKQALLARYDHDHNHDHDRDEPYGSGNANAHSDPRPAWEIADQVLNTLLATSAPGTPSLQRTLDTIVGTNGWTQKVAEWVLVKLEAALKQANSNLSPAVKEAYDKACEVALSIKGFVHEHPVFCTVIALGVLVLISPWVLEALGFAELGPVEGSFAAWWQRQYAGFVPSKSLFSFFQRLGMTWRRASLGGK